MGKTAPMLSETFPALRDVEMEHYWEGVLAVAPDRFPRLMRLADGVTFLGVYSGRGVALSSALGSVVGKWLAGRLGNEALPVPVTELRLIPMHGLAVQVARFVHPYHRLQDRLS
jgi:glycine/D-amino acid oxidase-like deaminating enzyme